MPPSLRLPAEIGDGEVRVAWATSDDGTGLHAWGVDRAARMMIHFLEGPRLDLRKDIGLAEHFGLRQSVLVDRGSIVSEMEALGLDPSTLVLSIRRKGDGPAPPPAPSQDDLRGRIERAQDALSAARAALSRMEETRHVFVLDPDDKEAIESALDEAVEAVAATLRPIPESADEEPVPPRRPERSPPPAAYGAGHYERVMVLRWEDVSEDYGDGGDPAPPAFFRLYDKEAHVGDVFAREDGTFKWQCFPGDWRSVETSLREARDALVCSYVQHYVHSARELVRDLLGTSSAGR